MNKHERKALDLAFRYGLSGDALQRAMKQKEQLPETLEEFKRMGELIPCDNPCEHLECQRFEECRTCTTLTSEPFECAQCKTKYCDKCAARELSICGRCNLEFCSKCDCGHDQWGVK